MKHVTLLFIRQGDKILLAMKKRGFGAGKWNGVGGKVQEGETYKAACVRECEEEIGITPDHPVRVGHIRFFDPRDPSFEHDAHIFVALSYTGGEPRESDEMRPEWFGVDKIPYDDMWPVDHLWLPHLLNGELFEGTVTTTEDKVAEHHIQVLEKLD
jgi:ADP-ribose pyrophosphatase YjhB (NUDIX family)